MSKKILVVGMARSGLAAVKYLAKKGHRVFVNDSKSIEDLGQVLDELKAYEGLEYILGQDPSIEVLAQLDLVVVSPGVPLDLDFLVRLREMARSHK